MSIKELYTTLRDALPHLVLVKYDYHDNPNFDHIFYNLGPFNKAYYSVKSITSFLVNSDIEKSLQPILKNGEDNLTAYKKQAEEYIVAANSLRVSVQNFLDFLDKTLLPDKNESSIDVKLIHIQNLDDLEKTANLLKRSFSTPVLALDGQVTVERVESGSILLTIGIIAATSMALHLCANMIWAAVAIQNKVKDMKMHEEYIKTLKIKNDYFEGLVEHHLTLLSQIKEAEAQHIINEFLSDKNTPDMVANIKGSVDAISNLIGNGLMMLNAKEKLIDE